MKVVRRSRAVKMGDGVSIAVDIVLPMSHSIFVDEGPPTSSSSEEIDVEALPAVLFQTRYWRSFLAKGQSGGPSQGLPISVGEPPVKDFIESGFAVVLADVRGTGASEGDWMILWSDKEKDDSAELVAWISDCKWCNGKVVSAGVSYEGTTAVLAAMAPTTSNGGGLAACVARSFEWNVYHDIAWPGGLFNDGFVRIWSNGCKDLDSNKAACFFPWSARMILKGVRPLDDDPKSEKLMSLVGGRNNPSVYDAISSMTAPDSKYGASGVSLYDVSLSTRIPKWMESVKDGDTAPKFQVWGSWMDGTTSRSALQFFASCSHVKELYVGAWSHTGEHQASFGEKSKPKPPVAEQREWQLDFLRAHVNCGEDNVKERVIHYFHMGRDEWRTTSVWPPEGNGSTFMFLHCTTSTLGFEAESDSDEYRCRTYKVDVTASTGCNNRWHTQLAKPVAFNNRTKAAKKLCAFRSSPLERDFDITGEIWLSFTFSANYTDPPVFAYLECVDSRGNVKYITESVGRPSHTPVCATPRPTLPDKSRPKEVSDKNFDFYDCDLCFLPTSVHIPKGWRLQVGLAGVDSDTFPVDIPDDALWHVLSGSLFIPLC